MEESKKHLLEVTNGGRDIFGHFITDLAKRGTGNNFNSVFRDDHKNPDANVFFNKQKGIWLYHDFVTGETLNPFDFVMKLRNCDFSEAIKIIKQEILVNESATHKLIQKQNQRSKISDFNLDFSDDYSYWKDYIPENIIAETMERYGVQSLKSLSYQKGGKWFSTKYKNEDPAFAFKISEKCYKVYRPHGTTQQAKHLWLGDIPLQYHHLFGLAQLPDFSEYILIVEGLKDAIVANAHGFISVGADHAATRIHTDDISVLKSKCNHILVCYDIDAPGKRAAEKTASEHGFKILTLPQRLSEAGGKDISDFLSSPHSGHELNDLIHATISEGNSSTKKIKESQRLSKFEKVEALITEYFDLRFNEVSNEIEYRKREQHDMAYETLNENNIYRFLQHNNIEFSMAKLTALLRSDFVPRFNPFKNYFNNLQTWCATTDKDHIDQLCNYVPVKDIGRFRVQFKKALVRTVACALKETVVNKQALILVHEEQNSGKTTFIRWLCPPDLCRYIAENISTDKDSMIALTENFMINMDELATLSRAEINMLKSMFSKDSVKVRRPYDKTATTSPRRASFFGSTNKSEFLTDESGSVRWLCFELDGRINWDYRHDLSINMIWSQAFALYSSGFEYELSLAEVQENDEANRQYQVTTQEIELVQKNYLPGTKEKHDVFYQASDIFNNLTEKFPAARLNLNNIGKALKMLGFERSCKRMEKYPVKGYYINFS